jgi:hypothetical protein
MPDRLDRVQIQLGSEPEPVLISWAAREELLSRLRGEHGPLDEAFRAVGASQPVTLDEADKEALLSVIDEWGAELGDYSHLPAGVSTLRKALLADLQDAAARGPYGVLDELIERYGRQAVVTASPRMLDDGKTYRWELKIDGEQRHDVSARERQHPEQPDVRLLLLVYGAGEVELGRWNIRALEPAAFVDTLGQLRDRRE